MMRRGVLPTIRKIADAMKVQPSTVSRWFPDGDFLKQVEEFGRSFRELGIDDS
jgi:DNA-binding transcriptional regulator YhcF (GntR family)